MADFEAEKRLVRDWHGALDEASGDQVASAAKSFLAEPYSWRGCHPFNEIDGVEQAKPVTASSHGYY